jgi:hypothetical protein
MYEDSLTHESAKIKSNYFLQKVVLQTNIYIWYTYIYPLKITNQFLNEDSFKLHNIAVNVVMVDSIPCLISDAEELISALCISLDESKGCSRHKFLINKVCEIFLKNKALKF